MILRFLGVLDHGIGAGQRFTGRSDNGPEDGLGAGMNDVFGEGAAVDFHRRAAIRSLGHDFNSLERTRKLCRLTQHGVLNKDNIAGKGCRQPHGKTLRHEFVSRNLRRRNRAVLAPEPITGFPIQPLELDARAAVGIAGPEDIDSASFRRWIEVLDAVPMLVVRAREDVINIACPHQRPDLRLVGFHRPGDGRSLRGGPFRAAVAAVGRVGMPTGRAQRSGAEFIDRARGLPIRPGTGKGRNLRGCRA